MIGIYSSVYSKIRSITFQGEFYISLMQTILSCYTGCKFDKNIIAHLKTKFGNYFCVEFHTIVANCLKLFSLNHKDIKHIAKFK